MANELYRELKQYIHNELHITRDDIMDMIRICVSQEVEKVLSDTSNYNKFLGNQIDKYLKENGDPYQKPFYTRVAPRCLDQVVYNTVVEEVCKSVKERVVVKLQEPKSENLSGSNENSISWDNTHDDHKGLIISE